LRKNKQDDDDVFAFFFFSFFWVCETRVEKEDFFLAKKICEKKKENEN